LNFFLKLPLSVYRIWSCWFWNCYVRKIFRAFWSYRPESEYICWWFPVESLSSGGFLVYELIISGGIPFLGWKPRPWGSNSWQNTYLFRKKRVLAHRISNVLQMVTIPGFLTPVYCKCWAHCVPKVLWIVKVPGFLQIYQWNKKG
jgi:hypothetical protein